MTVPQQATFSMGSADVEKSLNMYLLTTLTRNTLHIIISSAPLYELRTYSIPFQEPGRPCERSTQVYADGTEGIEGSHL